MRVDRMWVVVSEGHRAVIEFPESIRSGPVELTVLVPNKPEEGRKPQEYGHMAAVASELAKDPRPCRDLPPEERSARLEKVMGAGRGLMSTSEEFAKRKAVCVVD
jgi:hypothetical protein